MENIGGFMKLRVKVRILSACMVLILLVSACGSTAENLDTENVNIEKESTEMVAAANNTESVTEMETEAVVEEIVVEPELTPEELEWQNYVMPKVNDSLNVRAEASQESEIVGKLAKGDRAEIVEIGEEWTQITSGNVEGYIKNSYCIYGTDALEYAKENCETIATTTTGSLRLRAGMGTDTKIIKTLEKGKELVVNTSAESNEEWVPIKYGSNTYYVSAEYVTLELVTGTGLTTEELAAIEKRKAEERAAAEKAKKEAAAAAAQAAATAASVIANVDDHTLLAAIISCESGGEPYETQLAVGAVVMNRVRAGYGGAASIKDVLLARGQFPPATNGTLTKKLTTGKISQTSMDAATAALSGQDNTYGCLYFNRDNGRRQGIKYGKMIFW